MIIQHAITSYLQCRICFDAILINLFLQLLVCIFTCCCFVFDSSFVSSDIFYVSIDFSGIFIHTSRKIASTIGQRSIDTGFLFQCLDLPMLFVCILIEIFQRATDGIIFLNNISILLIISALIQLTENSFDIVLICINLIHLFSIESTIGIIPLSLELFDSSLVLCNLIL